MGDPFFELSPDLLVIVGADLKLKAVNPSFKRVMGFSDADAASMRAVNLIHPDDLPRITEQARSLQSGHGFSLESRCQTKSGDWRWLSWSAVIDAPTGQYYAIARDVTQQKQLEAELVQAQKLEAIGQLASGVAHEINNPIQFVGDNIRFVSDSVADLNSVFTAIDRLLDRESVLDEDLDALRAACEAADYRYLRDEIPKSLHEARDGVRRVAQLVRALKEFSNSDQPEMSVADINEALERTVVLVRSALKHIALIELELTKIPNLECHIGALNQVFLNIIVNAAHAIEDRGEAQGRIRISTRLEKTQVVIAISDNGTGIAPEHRTRVFDPFFSTKEVGRGTGQGLSMARITVVDRHHGQLTFETEMGVGTTFFIRLPVTQVTR